MKLDLAAFELVSIDGEMALILRLGRRSTDPIPAMEKISRSFRMKEPDLDTVGPFLAKATRPASGARCRAMPLYRTYCAWCAQHGAEKLSLVGFYRAMTARGFRQVVSNGHWWLDLTLVGEQKGPLL
ncbi:hypothetical protein [Allopontixanthobacter sp.]|uniref:hypothetical protein n=1 Tax=Allopontixanthobacter sp. TaxID=2906452 RepID=UPI002ABCE0B5|nr:hypothetical protein [Allopontixanthobacter sp.]MDZ4307176.1 hypothetical protein [Allopontixanthobacter sp.]